jgi:hypothetical protein
MHLIHTKIYSHETCANVSLALIVTEQRCFANRKRKRSVSHDFANGIQAGDKSSEVQAKEQMEVVTKSGKRYQTIST